MQNQSNQLPWNELLKKERVQRSWTQAEVAEKLGVDVKTVRRWERGKDFPFPLHRRGLTKIFEKSLHELRLDEEPNSTNDAQTPTQLDENPSDEESDPGDLAGVA